MPMGEKEKKQLIGLIGFLGLAAGGLFWYFWHQPKAVEMDAIQGRIDSLTILVDRARKDLAGGSLEALRQRVDDYQRSVRLMRRLVPEAQEIPNLLDDVSSRAKVRGLMIVQWTPLGTDNGTPYKTDRSRWSVAGHYDQIGEFLADVASLPRIMVPYDVTVGPASQDRVRQQRDTTGSLLEVGFQLKTFVKPPAAPSADSVLTGGGE